MIGPCRCQSAPIWTEGQGNNVSAMLRKDLTLDSGPWVAQADSAIDMCSGQNRPVRRVGNTFEKRL